MFCCVWSVLPISSRVTSLALGQSWYKDRNNVHPEDQAQGSCFVVFCCVRSVLPISSRVTSLALGQSWYKDRNNVHPEDQAQGSCFVAFGQFYPYRPGLLHWHWGNPGIRTAIMYIPRIRHRVHVLLCFVVFGQFYPYPPGLLHWHWGNPGIRTAIMYIPRIRHRVHVLLRLVSFTHILQGYFTGTGAILV